MSNVPDAMPEDLESRRRSLIDTLEGFCGQSDLPRVEIVGCLEGVKYALLRKWFDEKDDQDDEEDWR